MSNYKYHSTNQFRQVVKNITEQAKYIGYDEVENKPIFDYTLKAPTLKYIGTTKLHGTNASIVIKEDGEVTFHSKSRELAKLSIENEFTLNNDNADFAQSMYRRISGVESILDKAGMRCVELHGKLLFPIKISGEWVGKGVQKGVGISCLDKRSLFIFGVKFGETDLDNGTGWCSVKDIEGIEATEYNIFNITSFPTVEVDIDFENLDTIQNTLIKHTMEVEEQCPVSKQLGITQETVGEGLVWTPVDSKYVIDTGTWFKTKGEKHSSSKVKTLAAVNVDLIRSVNEFIDYTVTENRLNQGLSEVGLDQTKIGAFIKWMSVDINKEESDTLEENNLTMRDVGSSIAKKSREFYFSKLSEI